ncbi:hypothetical protein L798_00180 [Zootermopsis nevadensis]|uniref:Uncharacterized protein n=1 Tax=Zootermopsis nevadensis TaxID=136037 RepID=A0A067RQF9_ZOONE|nr:hypothetical protein L798_00180 [Zootermopsis nevadensis]
MDGGFTVYHQGFTQREYIFYGDMTRQFCSAPWYYYTYQNNCMVLECPRLPAPPP